MNTSTIATFRPADIVIDLETLGLEPGCAIIAIGAATAVCSPEEGKYEQMFYTTVSKESCTAEGLHINLDTLAWWNKQNAAARLEAFSGQFGIKDALIKFTAWLHQFESPRLWGNAASFDLKILEAAYKHCGIPVPWGYRQEMCYRTLKSVFCFIPAPKPIVAHKAIDDAVAEARHLAMILNYVAASEERRNN